MRLNILEKDVRLRNLVIFGVEESESSYSDLEDLLLKIINTNLNVKLSREEIQHARRMGKKQSRPRPINFALTTLGKKILILKSKSKLNDHAYYIKEDYPPHVLEIRKSLQEQLKTEKAQGKKAFLKYDKLIIMPHNENITETGSTNTSSQFKKRTFQQSPPSLQYEKENSKNPSNQPKKHKTNTDYRSITQYLNVEAKTATSQSNQSN